MTSTQFNIVVRGAGSLTFDTPEDEVWLQDEHHKVIWTGNPAKLIELILLGKLHKAQLQAMGKKESIVPWVSALPHLQCDLCGKPTTGQNPHYDCEQREAYLANNLREVLDNG